MRGWVHSRVELLTAGYQKREGGLASALAQLSARAQTVRILSETSLKCLHTAADAWLGALARRAAHGWLSEAQGGPGLCPGPAVCQGTDGETKHICGITCLHVSGPCLSLAAHASTVHDHMPCQCHLLWDPCDAG